MCKQLLIASLPFGLFLILAAWAIRLKKASKFETPADPFWPYAENPGLALELADSNEFVEKVLGDPTTQMGRTNRETAAKVQNLDFVFIALYVLFLSFAPYWRSGWSRGLLVVIVLALLTAIFDVIEDLQILRMVRKNKGSAKLFGQIKWFFYFATIGAEGALFFFETARSGFRTFLGMAVGLVFIAIALGGIISSIKASFAGISSATKLSVLALFALAVAPLTALYPYSLRVTAEYLVLMRVPLLVAALLFALPFIAFLTGAKTLLRGLFDLTPLSLFVVTLSALAVAGTACVTASIILHHASVRFHFGNDPPQTILSSTGWLILMVGLSLPVIGFSVGFSAWQKHGLARLILAALSGLGLGIAVSTVLLLWGSKWLISVLPFVSSPGLLDTLRQTELFSGYVGPRGGSGVRDPWLDHLFAAVAFAVTSILYGIVGFYGWTQLGKKRTVPALCSLLMLILMLGWFLSGVAFFFDAWRIPTLLIVAAVALLTAQSSKSDHFYTLRRGVSLASNPAETITASKESRVIVVAANGGGIQAGAWAAQVLYGLHQDFPGFQKALRIISSVSGGSMGNAMFVHWLANQDIARRPDEAAAMSSLDEVAWGLAWPDFLRALIPWLLGGLMGRGRALERAWVLNSAPNPEAPAKIDESLSSWNELVNKGKIPAVVMNATIAETGERLLFGTTQLTSRFDGGALVDARELLTINGEKFDVGVVTAARLSATFPYVTPAARAAGPGPQPHVVDGGYYDNYGMATMVEWLDQALAGAGENIKSVLVIQIHGAPVNSDLRDERHAKDRGWFYQVFAPITTLNAVRNAGQVAHNDIELELLQQKWSKLGVPIHTVTFEFHNPNAPLSWHLTRREVEEIRKTWRKDMDACKIVVKEFLNANDDLKCGCIKCKSSSDESQAN